MTLPGSEPTYLAHLTDAQFAQCFTGEPLGIDVHRHLAGCEPCRAEVTAFGESANRLGKAALTWSARQRVPIQPHSARLGWLAAWLPAGAPLRLATAAVALLLVASPIALHRAQLGGSALVTTALPSNDTEVVIAQDNSLLQSVDGAIAETETDQSPFQQYQLEAVPGNESGTRSGSAGRLGLP